MGLIDKFKRGGGGFLNNVDGKIVDVTFTTDPDFGGETFERKEGAFTTLWAKLTARVDGQDEDVSTHLRAGNADSFVISDDGRTLTRVDPSRFDLFGAFRDFYESAVRAGVPDFTDEAVDLDFSSLIGWRVRFVQVRDEGQMKYSAKGYKKSNGKFNELGQKKGRDGKFYDQRRPEVERVYAREEGGNGTVRTTANTNPVRTRATKTLVEILSGEKTRSIAKGKLNMAITRKLVGEPEVRDDVRKYLYDDANLKQLEAENVIKYDQAHKDQIISLN